MNYEEALILSTDLIGRISSLSTEDNKLIERLSKEVLLKEVRACNCKDRHTDALIEIYNYLKTNKKMKEKSKYILKPGAVIQVFGDPRIYTNENITDEVAKEFLAKNPKLINQFAHIPEEHFSNERKNSKDTQKEGR